MNKVLNFIQIHKCTRDRSCCSHCFCFVLLRAQRVCFQIQSLKINSWTVWLHSSLCVMFIKLSLVQYTLFWNKDPTDCIAKPCKICENYKTFASQAFEWPHKPHRLWELIRKKIALWKSSDWLPHDLSDSFFISLFKAQKFNTGFEISLVYSHIRASQSSRSDISQIVLEFSCTPRLLLAFRLQRFASNNLLFRQWE